MESCCLCCLTDSFLLSECYGLVTDGYPRETVWLLPCLQVPDLRNSPVPFTHLSFSNDGKLLLGVAEGRVFVLDAFTGSLMRSFPNGVTEAGAAPEASLSYDGQYVLSGGCRDCACAAMMRDRNVGLRCCAAAAGWA
jgi:hypothetical protein